MERYVLTHAGAYNHNLGEWVRASEAFAKVKKLQEKRNAMRERLSEQIEDNGRIHDEKMKYYLQAQYLRERLVRLEAELQHQKELYAAHIGDEHENCGMAINKRLVEAIKIYQNKSIELLKCNSEETLAIAKKEFETSASDLSEAIAAAESGKEESRG